jgi:hypothetical protein
MIAYTVNFGYQLWTQKEQDAGAGKEITLGL